MIAGYQFDGDSIRWINVVLSSLVVALLIAGAWLRWDSMPRRFRRITPWVICTYVILAYGSGEAATSDASPGIRVSLLLLDLIGLVIALLYRIGDETYDEP
jgi:hypothetical protein